MNKFCLIILALFVGMQTSKAYETCTINENWQFSLNGKSWQTIDVPHTWNKTDAFTDQPYYRGKGTYQRKLNLSEKQLKKVLFLQFDGVNAIADLFINGQFVGNHTGGYTAFRFSINEFVHNGPNDIKLVVNNELNQDYPPLDGDFTMFGGIYRDVQLIETESVHIDLSNMASSGVFVTQSEVSKRSAIVAIKTRIVNNKEYVQKAVLSAEIVDAENNLVQSFSEKIILKPNVELDFNKKFGALKKPHLWSPDHPYLYKVIVRLKDEKGNVFDSRIEPLGIRWFSVDAEKGFFLNGKPLKLIGVNRHQDFAGFGNAVPDFVHLNDMKLIKEMGSNFLRIAHYPQDKVILEECDRLGILCCVEVPLNNRNNVFSKLYWENTMLRQQEMVRQSFNHPSVVIWAMLNECLLRTKLRPPFDSNDPYLKKTGEFAASINALLKKEDPDRLTMIVNSEKPDIHLAAGTGLTPDIIGWNLYHCWYGEEKFDSGLNDFITDMRFKFPGKAMMITEYGAGADPRISCSNPHRWDFSREYQLKVHKHFMETILKRDDVMGGTVWNFADFASAVRQDTEPNMNSKGLMSNNRIAKESYYYYQVLLSKKTIVRIASRKFAKRIGHQDESSESTCTQSVEVFGKGGNISLKCNGKLIATKKPDEHNSATFQVPFINGHNFLEANCGDEKDFIGLDYQIIDNDPSQFDGVVNVSVGDHRQYISRNGICQTWISEKEYQVGSWGYVGGKAILKSGLPSVGTALNIYRTDDDPLFQSHREGIEAFKFDVKDGYYEVSLLFMEPNTKLKQQALIYELGKSKLAENDSKQRIFNVKINEKVSLQDFNILEEVGARTALVKKISFEVNNREGVNIEFVPVQGQSILSGISLRKIR